MTHAEIEVANDLPRKGPSGTYSQAWTSRADQSLRPTTPKTWSAKSSAAMGLPSTLLSPITNPSSASMSRRVLGPNSGPSSAPPGDLRWPLGRMTGVPLGTTVPPRPW